MYNYSMSPNLNPSGCCEIELVIEKIRSAELDGTGLTDPPPKRKEPAPVELSDEIVQLPERAQWLRS